MTARNTSVSAAYSSASSQRSAAKPPSTTLSCVLQPAQIEHSGAPAPPAPAPVSPQIPRPPSHPEAPCIEQPAPECECRSDPAAAPIPSRHTVGSSAVCTCTPATCH